jgi:hypothetical protein
VVEQVDAGVLVVVGTVEYQQLEVGQMDHLKVIKQRVELVEAITYYFSM